jgi:protein phosphatase inhibitor 2
MDGDYEEDDRKPAAIDRNAMSAPIDAAADTFSTAAAAATAYPTMRVKPALKKGNRSRRSATSAQSSSASGAGAAMNADSTTSATINKHLKWDEQVIEEHDLLRGTRMKIDEPNTPYTHYDSGSESDHSRPKSPAHQKTALSWDNLQSRLDSVVAVREQFAAASAASAAASSAVEDQTNAAMDASSSDVEEEIRNEMRILEFREHRKRHYNEMELVRQFRQQQPDSDEDDDLGDDDGRPPYGSVAHANGGMD